MKMLSQAKFFILNTIVVNFGYVAKIYVTKPNFSSKYQLLIYFIGLHIETESARNMKMSFQSKIMSINFFSVSSKYNL